MQGVLGAEFRYGVGRKLGSCEKKLPMGSEKRNITKNANFLPSVKSYGEFGRALAYF